MSPSDRWWVQFITDQVTRVLDGMWHLEMVIRQGNKMEEIQTQSPERQKENRKMEALNIIDTLQEVIRDRKIETARIVRDIVDRAWTEEDGTDYKKTEVIMTIDEIIRHLERRVDD